MRLLPFLLASLPVVAHAAPQKIAVLPFTGGAGVSEKAAGSITEAAVGELRRLPDIVVVTPQEVLAVLTLDQQRQALGCAQGECVTDLGSALGAERLVTGSIAVLGESWLVHLKLLDVKRAAAMKQVDRRLRGKGVDDVLDALGPMLAELLDRPATAPERIEAAVQQKPEAAGSSGSTADVVEALADEVRARMKVATDGSGFYVAWDPERGTTGTFYAGNARKLWAQRVFGGSRNGDEFSAAFWEPRARSGWQKQFGFREGRYSLQCGDQAVALTELPAAETKAFVAKATFHGVRWQRQAEAIARDDDGNYWFIDNAREPRDATAFRMFFGRRGKVKQLEVDDYLGDGGGEVWITPNGKLKLDRRARTAEWIEKQARTPLVYLDIEDQVAFVYGALGAYRGEQLGTACDGRW